MLKECSGRFVADEVGGSASPVVAADDGEGEEGAKVGEEGAGDSDGTSEGVLAADGEAGESDRELSEPEDLAASALPASFFSSR